MSQNNLELEDFLPDQRRLTIFDQREMAQFSLVPPEHIKPILKQSGATAYYVREYTATKVNKFGEIESTQRQIQTLGGYGVTEAFDDRVLLALFNFAYQKQSSNFQLSMQEIVTFLGVPNNADYRQKIFESCCRLESTLMLGEWLDPETDNEEVSNIQVLKKFGRVRAVSERSVGNRKTKSSHKRRQGAEEIPHYSEFELTYSIVLPQLFCDSLAKEGILLDLNLFRALKNVRQERFYRFLNLTFHLSDTIDPLPISVLLEKTGMKPYKHNSTNSAHLVKKFIQPMVEAGVLAPFDLQRDIIKEPSTKNYFYRLRKGELYFSDLKERSEGKRGFLLLYKLCLNELKLAETFADQLIQFGRKHEDFFFTIEFCVLANRVAPLMIKNNRAWLKKAKEDFTNGKKWDHEGAVEVLRYLITDEGKLQNPTRTRFQQSWQQSDFDETEKKIFDWLNNKNINNGVILRWLQKGEPYRKRCLRVMQVYDAWPTDLQTEGFIVSSINDDHYQLWQDPISGTDHARVVRQDKNETTFKKHQTIIPDKIEIIEDDEFEESQNYYITHKDSFDSKFGSRLFSTLKRLAKKRNLSDSYFMALLEAACEENWESRELIAQIESL